MRAKNLTPLYTSLQCLYWMTFSGAIGLTSVYMLAVGFNSTQTGLMIALAGLAAAVLQPVIASYADSAKSIGLKKIMLCVGVLIAMLAAAMLLTAHRKAGTVIFFGLTICLMQVMTPLLNALGVGSANAGGRLNIGLARGAGSLAYAVSVSVLGALVERRGAGAVPAAIFILSAIFCVLLPAFPGDIRPQENAKQSMRISEFFRKYPSFLWILSGALLLFIGHVLVNSFAYQVALIKGGDSRETGIAMGLAAAVELPTMVFFSVLLKKRPAGHWFAVSGIFLTAKALGTLLCPGILGYYAVQIFQMGGWAMISVSSIYYINSIMAPGDTVKGQAYYGMTYTMGSVLGAVVGGWLIDAVGVGAMLTFASAVSAIGTAIVIYFVKKAKAPVS